MVQERKPKKKKKTKYCVFQLQPHHWETLIWGWIYLSWMKKRNPREELINSQGPECLVAQLVKNLPAMRETSVRSLGWENPLEKGTATHSSILAWRIPWTVYSPWVAKSQTQLSDFHFHFHFHWGLVWPWLRNLLVERPGMDIYLLSIMKSVQGHAPSPLD